MFCPNCGNNCENANFCPKCGTKLPQQEVSAIPMSASCSDDSFELPKGEYGNKVAFIEFWDDGLIIHRRGVRTKKLDLKIAYEQLSAVKYFRSNQKWTDMVALAFRCVNGLNTELPTKKEMYADPQTLPCDVGMDLVFYHIFCVIRTLAPAHVRFEVELPKQTKDIPASDIDLDGYFKRFNPYREEAAAAVCKEQGIKKENARILVDEVFDRYQKELYDAEPAMAIRDLNRVIFRAEHPESAIKQEKTVPEESVLLPATETDESSAQNSGEEKAASDLDRYYHQYKPDREAAMTALRIDTGMGFLEAKKKIDLLFDFYQSKTGENQPEEKEIIFCPKCYSSEVILRKRGFDFAAAWLAEKEVRGGFLLGTIGADKLIYRCKHCKYTWEP